MVADKLSTSNINKRSAVEGNFKAPIMKKKGSEEYVESKKDDGDLVNEYSNDNVPIVPDSAEVLTINHPKDAIDNLLVEANNLNSNHNSPTRRNLDRFNTTKDPTWVLTPTRLNLFDEIKKGDSPRSPNRSLAGAIAEWDPEREERLRRDATEKVSKWAASNMQRREYMSRRYDEEQRKMKEEEEAARVASLEQSRAKQEDQKAQLVASQMERTTRRKERERELKAASERLEALEKMVSTNPPLYVRKQREFESVEKDFERLKLEEIQELKSVPIKDLKLNEGEGKYLEDRQIAFDRIRAERKKDSSKLSANDEEIKRFSKDRSKWLQHFVDDYSESLKNATLEEKVKLQKQKMEQMRVYGNMKANNFKQEQAALGHGNSQGVQTIPNHPPFKAGLSHLGRSLLDGSPSRAKSAYPSRLPHATAVHEEVYNKPLSEDVRVFHAETVNRYGDALSAIQKERESSVWRDNLLGANEPHRDPERERLIMQEINRPKEKVNEWLQQQAFKRKAKLETRIQDLNYEKQELLAGGGSDEMVKSLESKVNSLESELQQEEPLVVARGASAISSHVEKEKAIAEAYLEVIKKKLGQLEVATKQPSGSTKGIKDDDPYRSDTFVYSAQERSVNEDYMSNHVESNQHQSKKQNNQKPLLPAIVELRSTGTPVHNESASVSMVNTKENFDNNEFRDIYHKQIPSNPDFEEHKPSTSESLRKQRAFEENKPVNESNERGQAAVSATYETFEGNQTSLDMNDADYEDLINGISTRSPGPVY